MPGGGIEVSCAGRRWFAGGHRIPPALFSPQVEGLDLFRIELLPKPAGVKSVSKATFLGLLGYPLESTLSPRLHGRAFAARGMNCRYLPLSVAQDSLAAALGGLRGLGFVGANVTIPHKERVIPLLDTVDPAAARIGAVNTIVRREDGCLEGRNTDGPGFLAGLAEVGLDSVAGITAAIIGAGGAARAVAAALVTAGAGRLVVANRDPERAVEVARTVGAGTGAEAVGLPLDGARLAPDLQRAGLVVNCTPVSFLPGPSGDRLGGLACLGPGCVVVDLVYAPPDTELLAAARARGLRTQNGLPMLVHQAALSWMHWFGEAAPVDVMRQVAEEYMAPKASA